MTRLIDVHSHVTPPGFPESPNEAARPYWPCMRCASDVQATVMIGDRPFRELDSRSWDTRRRIEDMDRDGISMQVLSPMPELLSYWLDDHAGRVICEHVNVQIAEMIAAEPKRFRGLGSVPLQDPVASVKLLRRLRDDFGLSGVEIGSNIAGLMLGDPRFDPFWEAAQDLGVAVFVHALHPVAVKSIQTTPTYTTFAAFPIDIAMAAASLIINGTIERFPRLRIAFSHGGGALGSILGRLDRGWRATSRYGIDSMRRPSEQARSLFYDSNVYDPAYLRYLIREMAPGHVFVGTDYPYAIMQQEPADYVRDCAVGDAEMESLSVGAAERFLAEDLHGND
jgi:aminocarboxymuconate-semialdehyde decarboxylase